MSDWEWLTGNGNVKSSRIGTNRKHNKTWNRNTDRNWNKDRNRNRNRTKKHIVTLEGHIGHNWHIRIY